MNSTTSLPSTSALPALEAAMDVLRDRATPQRLHTYGGCVFDLIPETPGGTGEAARASARTSPIAAPAADRHTAVVVVSSDSDSDGEASCIHTPLDAGRAASATVPDQATSSDTYPAVHIHFTHAIPYAQLNQYANLHHELRTALHAVAPHCTYVPPPASPQRANAAALSIFVPSEVPPQERSAALAFSADLRLHALLPVVAGVLERCAGSEQQEYLALMPDDADGPAAAAVTSRSAGAALYVCATPMPSTSSIDSVRGPAHGTAAPPRPFFEGTVALTVCVTATDAADAALVRRYLGAFAEADRAPVMLHVRESADPPRHVGAPPRPPPTRTAAALASTSAAVAENAGYVWWCTFVLAPHQLLSVAGLTQGLRWALDLRLSVLHHVHQERMAMHAQLRQQLSTYAAYFY